MRAILIVVLAILAACAHVVPPAEPAPVADRYAHTPFDTAWHRAIVFFTDAHVTIQTIDKSSGILASSRFQLPFAELKDWGDCGTASTGGKTLDRLDKIHNIPTAFADFNVVMLPTGDSTAVRTSLSISANARAMNTVGDVGVMNLPCVSNGKFERDLFAYISGHAAG